MTVLSAQLLDDYHRALLDIINGSPDGYRSMYSQRDDVTLANPFGPVARGRTEVEKRLRVAAANYRDGELIEIEQIAAYETPQLAYLVEVERFRAKVGGRQDLSPVALRSTSIFRLEEGEWKLVHRHGDPITTERPAESVLQI